MPSTPNHPHSVASTDTELSTLDTHELWLPDSRFVAVFFFNQMFFILLSFFYFSIFTIKCFVSSDD